jgi:aspartate aminotransferase
MPTTQALADRISLISASSTMKVAADADRLRREVMTWSISAGEPDFPTPQNIKQAAIKPSTELHQVHQHRWHEELKQTICDSHKAEYGTAYSTKECIVTVGGKHAIFNLTQALVEPGDEVVIPVPYWVTYKDVVNYAGGKCVFVDTDESDGFRLDASMIERALTPKTKMIMLNSPSNPSGAVFERSVMERVFQIAKDRGIWLMTDECYHRFLYEGAPHSLAAIPGAKDTVLVAGSLSKTYSMTGWRIGFVLGPAPVVGGIGKLQSHATSNPTSFAQKGAIEALRGPQESVGIMLAEYKTRRDYVIGRLRAMPGVTAQMPQGAFYAYPNVSAAFKNGIASSLQFSEKLLAENSLPSFRAKPSAPTTTFAFRTRLR